MKVQEEYHLHSTLPALAKASGAAAWPSHWPVLCSPYVITEWRQGRLSGSFYSVNLLSVYQRV